MAKLVKRSSKNQITLPKEMVEHFGNARYFEVRDSGDAIMLSPVKTSPVLRPEDALEEMSRSFQALGLSDEELDEAVHWAKGKQP